MAISEEPDTAETAESDDGSTAPSSSSNPNVPMTTLSFDTAEDSPTPPPTLTAGARSLQLLLTHLLFDQKSQ